KFVSMTLRPTPTIFPEIFAWRDAPPSWPTSCPWTLGATCGSVLQNQSATCFESATLLCSLLLGNHYDAYCVSGYAVREMCLMDRSLQECPLLDTQVKGKISEEEPQEARAEETGGRGRAASQTNYRRRLSSHPLTPCEVCGCTAGCWCCQGVAASGRTSSSTPCPGTATPSEDANFLGIESVWNNLNYYVNMQDCRDGCADEQQLRVFEMPRSWVSYINIAKKDLESRWPGRQEVTRYRKAKLEKFAVYLSQDGLVTRLTRYKDLDLVMVRELYHQRDDHLVEREINEVDKFTTERFRRGRTFHLLFHRYTSNSTDTDREMEFSSDRGEDLLRRVESSDEMTESFEGRRDFLYCRHVFFKPQISREDLESHLKVREIEKIVERFRRDGAKPASEDVAERVFLLNERRIELTYHLEDHRFIPSKRSFIKPLEATDEEKAEAFRLYMVSSFQVDPSEKPLKTLTLYQMLMSLMKSEEEVVLQVRNSKKEVQEIMDCRHQEEEDLHIDLSPWTTSGVTRARSQREEMVRHTRTHTLKMFYTLFRHISA
ncbi:hypothetical protein KUCAC02_013207, partial [Chaenocephalus aceratus]